MNFVPYNLNQYVKVKLNLNGVEIYYRKCNRMPEIDSDGYTEMQFHDLINAFGGTLGWGADVPFGMNVLIESK